MKKNWIYIKISIIVILLISIFCNQKTMIIFTEESKEKEPNHYFAFYIEEPLLPLLPEVSLIEEVVKEEDTVKEEKEEKQKEEEKEEATKQETHLSQEVIQEESKPQLENPPTEKKEQEDQLVIETFVGTISGYGPDCVGCTSNKTASGHDLSNGNIYFQDETYGKIRILSGDKKYPFGTIVRIKNCDYFESEIIGIILDRGGSVGFGKKVQFDLLFAKEEETVPFGKRSDVTFEILRLGYK